MAAILQENLTNRRGRPSMNAMTPLGRRIQQRRKELELTLDALAARTGLLPQTINAIERGTSKQPRLATLRPLARALDEDLTELAALAYEEESAISAPLSRELAPTA